MRLLYHIFRRLARGIADFCGRTHCHRYFHRRQVLVEPADAVDGREPISGTNQRYEIFLKLAFSAEANFDFITSTSDFCVQRLLIAWKIDLLSFLAAFNFCFEHCCYLPFCKIKKGHNVMITLWLSFAKYC